MIFLYYLILSSQSDCRLFFPPDLCSTTQAVVQVGSEFKKNHNIYLTGHLGAAEEISTTARYEAKGLFC